MNSRKRKSVGDESIFDVVEERERVRAGRTAGARRVRAKSVAALKEAVALLESGGGEDDLDAERRALESIQAHTRELRVRTADRHMTELRRRAAAVFRLAPEQLETRASLIIADPPWSYDNPSQENGTKRHYDTMSDSAIEQLPVGGLAGEDSALLLWATLPKLRAALQVMEAWGFKYTTVFMVWIKVQRYMARPRVGLGTYTKSNAELVLLGTRGSHNIKARAKGFNRINVLLSQPAEHSRKPAVVRRIAVELFGDLPRFELFCRASDSDWVAWGNQADQSQGRVESKPEHERHAATMLFQRRNKLHSSSFRAPIGPALTDARRHRLYAASTAHPGRHDQHTCMRKNEAIFIKGEQQQEEGAEEVDEDDDELYNNSMLTEYGEAATLERRLNKRHPVYTELSERQVRDNLPLIRSEQRLNSDKLFAYNYAKPTATSLRVTFPQ